MMNTRSKTRKFRNTLKTYYYRASIADSDTQSTQSGALIGSNDDLLIEILHRLPATSVLRFKSVSKHWLSLLSQRRFTLMYDNRSISPGLYVDTLYIPFDVETSNRSVPPSHSLKDHNIQVVQSCNGLLLCRGRPRNKHVLDYSVFNPTTKQLEFIPSLPGDKYVQRSIRFMGLAFHPLDLVHYKVICIRNLRPCEDPLQIQIYSSDTRNWKILNGSFTASYYAFSRSGVYWNGAFHWPPSCLNPMYINLDEEKLQKLPLPSPLPVRVAPFGGYCDGVVPHYLGESRGHLHLVYGAHLEKVLHLYVYEMLSDHSGWFIKYHVDLDELPIAYPKMIQYDKRQSSPDYYIFDVLDVVRCEEEEDTFMVVRIPGKMIRYNVHNKSFKQIFDLTNYFSLRNGYLRAHRYIETLTPF